MSWISWSFDANNNSYASDRFVVSAYVSLSSKLRQRGILAPFGLSNVLTQDFFIHQPIIRIYILRALRSGVPFW